MVGENLSLGQRAQALRWLVSYGARQPMEAARAQVRTWLQNRRGHSGQGITAADRAALDETSPQLQSLRERYAGLGDIVGTSTVWIPGFVRPEDLLYFRGDNCYVWQNQDNNTPEKYVLTYLYLKTIDTLGLLDDFAEDGDFGVFTYPTGDTDKNGNERFVSRDLLDSANELLFLDRTLQISQLPDLKVLDIGAGYGRLAYRAVSALPNIETYFCIDAVPESTFVSSHYLSSKGAARARVVSLDDQQDLVPGTIKLAVNILSFSECAIEAVEYWISRCAELKIEHLFIVPNISDGDDAVRLVNGTDYSPILANYGYHLSHVEPKYSNSEVQKYGISPKWYYLFSAS
jgi:hypothetical protein